MCAVNVAVNDNSVKTACHRDVQGFFNDMSCLCPFGTFSDGELILWELEAVIELRLGDLFFADHLINHSNETACGLQNLIVTFMKDKT